MIGQFKTGKLYRTKSSLVGITLFSLDKDDIVMCLGCQPIKNDHGYYQLELLFKKKILAGRCGNILIQWFEELP